MERSDIIVSEEREVYIYGTELMLSTIAGVLALVIVSICLGAYLQWLPYLAGFIPLRLFGGGYHAKSHKACILTFTSTYLICSILIRYCKSVQPSIVILSFICLIIIMVFSPVEAQNKKLDQSHRITNRTNSLVLAGINTLITIFYASNTINSNIVVTTYLSGYICAGLFMIIAVLTERNKERK